MFIVNLGVNLLSDLVFSLLLFSFYYLVFVLTKRRKLLRFFCIEKNKAITIFTSNLIVEKFGSLGHDGNKYSFQGVAIPNEESKAAHQIQTLFNYFLPSQIDNPDFFSKLLISDIDVKILPSPIDDSMVDAQAGAWRTVKPE